jgi:hypothetical protein
MNTQHVRLNIPLSFNQIIDIVRQLSPKEKLKLSEVLWEETDKDKIIISEEQKQIVRQRLKRMDEQPESCFTWKDIEHKIKL